MFRLGMLAQRFEPGDDIKELFINRLLADAVQGAIKVLKDSVNVFFCALHRR